MLLTLLLVILGIQTSKTQHPASESVDVVLLIDSSNVLGRQAIATNESLVITTTTPTTTYAYSIPIKVADCSYDLIADVVFVVDEAVSPENNESKIFESKLSQHVRMFFAQGESIEGFRSGCIETEKADIYFLVDGSSSISLPNFANMKTFLKELNEIADSGSKVYYVEQFDSLKTIKNEIVQDICSKKACEEMKGDVMFLVDSSGSISEQDFEKMKKFMKELVDKCSVDGQAHDNVREPASALRKEGVIIYSIGIGGANVTQLEEISGTQTKMFYLQDYDRLKIIEKDIIFGICTPYKPMECKRGLKNISTDLSNQLCIDSRRECDIEAELVFLTDSRSIPDKELKNITNSPSRKYKVDHYSDLKTLVNNINKEICKETTEATCFVDVIIGFDMSSQKPGDNLFIKNVTDIKNRNTVLLLFSDGLDDNIITLGQKSEEFRIQGLDGLITVALEGTKYIDQLQHIEFGKGFGYNTQLSIDTENVAKRIVQYMDQIAERKCCCILCRCEGEEGPRGERREKGPRGTTGFAGHPGYPGDDGEQGPRGIPGIQGKKGDIGQCGSRGRKGQRGLHGETGEDGADGVDAIHGEEGSLGFPGLKGEKGDPGEMGNTGPKGPPGDLGPKGFQGDHGESGQDNNIRGAKGFKGLSGRMGERGLRGSDGSAGSPGNKGAEGSTGPLGPKGEKGNLGSNGLQGDQGVQGSQGTTGVLGVKGEKGQSGNYGRLGDVGDEGPKGNQGKPGSRGNKGESGEPGKKGEKGSLGQQGIRGEEGTVGFGNIGRKGRKGIDGLPGDFGEQGKTGDMGNPGKRGLKGKSGRMGTPGLIGDGGELGTWGYPGHLGPKGAKGQPFYSPCELIEYIQKHSPCWTEIPKCPAHPTELVFAFDISQDTNSEIFEEMRKTVIDIVNQTNIRESNCPVGARVAVVSYSSKTNYLIRFTDFQSKTKLLQELNRLSFQRTTNRRDIGGSMRFVARHLFKRTLQGANVRKVAVFFSNGESDHPNSIGTAVLEFTALGIQPAVISFKNIPEITQAFEMDSTGLFQVIHLHQKSDYLSVLERLQVCVICYDKCKPDESCFRTPPFEPEAYMDAAFILENSRKISTTGFEELKHFLSRSLDSFDISANPNTSLIGPEYDYIELMELASLPLEHHMVQLGRIHKAELEYAVKFLKPLIHLLKSKIHSYPHPELKSICATISRQKPSTPFDKTPSNKIHLIDENGSAFPEYPQSDSLFPEKIANNAHPSIMFEN
ncbi:collagen alpha-6VI chain-like [Crotalus adamanteus]|uniref:Collagen alpha-6VI chain-like n=1 Tax=Crotalus adamanteus TaxID=8729 RepID=A0AAW1B2X1_CROAD